VAPNLIAVGIGVLLPGRRNDDKRIWDENIGLQQDITFLMIVGMSGASLDWAACRRLSRPPTLSPKPLSSPWQHQAIVLQHPATQE
jgi:hypothetical protein